MTGLSEQLQNELVDALRQGLVAETEKLTRCLLEDGTDPINLIKNVLVPTLTDVGRQFQALEIYLPELMGAGDAAQAATTVLEAAIASSGQHSAKLGTVVLGTVQGDIHDIGKNIVNTLLNSHGFRVVDLGRDVPPSRFLEAAEREKADIVALSALMTTTRHATLSTINLFIETNARSNYKIIVGGGCIDPIWAQEIGADGYAQDAASAVDLCKQLISVRRNDG